MNLVDDHRPGGRQHAPAGLRAQQDVKRFRRGDDDVGRPRRMRWRSPAGVSPVRTQVRISTSGSPASQLRTNAGQRSFEIPPDVVRQGLQRGDVDDLGLVAQRGVTP